MQDRIPTFKELLDFYPEKIEVPDYHRGTNTMSVNIKDSLNQCIQDQKHHPEGSVMKHMELIYKQIIHSFSKDIDLPILLTVLMFHDIAKLETKETEFRPDGTLKVSHIGHEHVATKYMDTSVKPENTSLLEYFVRKAADKFKMFHDCFITKDNKLNQDAIETVRDNVKEHMKMHIYNRHLEGVGNINFRKESWKNYPQPKKENETESEKTEREKRNSPIKKSFNSLKKFAHSDEHGRYEPLTDEDVTDEYVEDKLGNRLGFIPKKFI